MINKKGFTVLELILAFTLTTIVIVYLMQIISLVHLIYISSVQKTNLMMNQGNIMDQFYRDSDEKKLSSIRSCGSNCYTLTFKTGETKNISLDKSKKIVKYGDFSIKYDSKVQIGDIELNTASFVAEESVIGANLYDSIIQIKIPISVKNDIHDINLIYQYSSNLNNVTIN